MRNRSGGKGGSVTGSSKEAVKDNKPISLAWLVIAGPLSIVVFLSLFEGPPWVAEQSTKGAKGEATTHNTLGMIAMKGGRYQEAIGQFSTALAIKPDYPEPFMNMGILFNLQGDYDRAIKFFQKSLELEPKQKELVYNNLGMVYAKKGDYESAFSMFQRALTIDIKSVTIYRNIGELCAEIGDWEGAIETYRGAIVNRSTLKRLYVDMLNESLMKYEDDECYEVIKAHIDRGVTETDLAEYDSVIVNEFVYSDPKLAEDYKDLGVAYTRLGKLDEAIHSYLEALNIRPDYAVVYNKLGILYARNGDLTKALSAFEKAVDIDPDYDDALDNLRLCRRKLAEMGSME